MTLVVATTFTGRELCLLADSIVTRIDQPETVLIGRTSHNEAIQPITDINGRLFTYREEACKIGFIGTNLAISVCGALDAALDFIDVAFPVLGLTWTEASLMEAMERAVRSYQGHSISLHTEFVLFCALRENTPRVFGFRIAFTPGGGVSRALFVKRPEDGENFHCGEGSGAPLIKGYFPDALLHATRHDPTLLRQLDSLLVHDYGNYLRSKTNYEAAGVGGAFLGLILDETGNRYQRDTIVMLADAAGVIQYCCRTVFRGGYALVCNYIDLHVTVMRTIETEIGVRRGSIREQDEELRAFARANTKFQAEIVLIDYRDAGDNNPNVRIVEGNPFGVVKGLHLEGLPEGWEPALYPGGEITISTEKEQFKLRIRSPVP